MLESLPPASLQRFLRLRMRCYEMRDIASGVRGQTRRRRSPPDAIRTPGLDQLLFLFLKLLMSQDGLRRFLRSTSEQRAASARRRIEEQDRRCRLARRAATSA